MYVNSSPVIPHNLRFSKTPSLVRSLSLSDLSKTFFVNEKSAQEDFNNKDFKPWTEEERIKHLAIQDNKWVHNFGEKEGSVIPEKKSNKIRRKRKKLWVEGMDKKILIRVANDGQKRTHSECYNKAPIYNGGEITFEKETSPFPNFMNNRTGHYQVPKDIFLKFARTLYNKRLLSSNTTIGTIIFILKQDGTGEKIKEEHPAYKILKKEFNVPFQDWL